MKFIKRFPWVLPTIIFTIIILFAANMHPLWGDEAETALFARNILKYGVPKGWDGVNIMGINDAVVLNKQLINHTSPWAQYYLTAASFAVFGQNSFTARIPFILLSILSLPAIYYLAKTLTKEKLAGTLTLWILALSPAFILFAYQSRHYAITSFAGIILLLSLLSLPKKSIWPKIAFVASAILFFYANYVVFAAFFTSILIAYLTYLILQKTPTKEIGKTFALLCALTAVIILFTAPWYFIFKPFEGRGQIVPPEISSQYLKDFLELYKNALSPYNQNNGFPILFIPVLVSLILYLKKTGRAVSHILFISIIPLIYLLAMTILTAIGQVDTYFIHARYTMNIFPILSLLAALLVSSVWKWNYKLATVLIAVFLLTNLFTLQKPRSLLLEFAGELANPYQTPDKLVADYLKANAKDGDTAFVSLDRDHEPLIFHLGDKIRFVNRVTLLNTRIFPKNRSILSRYVYDFRDSPDWVILYSKRTNDGSFLVFDQRPLWPEINLETDYKEIVLPVFFADMSRPEIDLRSFKKVDPAQQDQVFVYQKIQ